MMKFLRRKMMALSVFTLGFGMANPVLAADTRIRSPSEAMNVCTHVTTKTGIGPSDPVSDEARRQGRSSYSWLPVMPRHERKHLESPVNAPDVKYTKGSTNTAAERTEKCLSCHKTDARSDKWDGSAHQSQRHSLRQLP